MTMREKRLRTTALKTKHELLEGRHVIDITDERLAARRREDMERSLGHMSAIHQPEPPPTPGSLTRWWRRATGTGRH
jgi:hypothetical protein